jgi:hypothetical protein
MWGLVRSRSKNYSDWIGLDLDGPGLDWSNAGLVESLDMELTRFLKIIINFDSTILITTGGTRHDGSFSRDLKINVITLSYSDLDSNSIY